LINLATLLAFGKKAVQLGGVALAKAPEFVELYSQATAALHPQDQATAKEAYADLIAENDEGFARLDAKLEEAKKR
jgi:hypothetical protein